MKALTAPPPAAVNRQLAARFHQRQAELVVAARRVASRVRRHVGERVRPLVQLAAEKGLAATPSLRELVDRFVRIIVDELHDELAGVARRSWTSAAHAIVDVLPRPLLAYLLQRGRLAEDELEILPLDYLTGLRADRLRQMANQLIFPPPDAETVERWLTEKPPGGLSWDERLRRWAEKTRAAMLSELVIGLAAGETPDELEMRLRPLADGLAYKSERIARTEAVRVAQRANLAACSQLGDLLTAYQIIAVMDEHTRPHHAARHGRTFWRSEDGLFRDQDGNVLPDLPDEPNCRCMTVPVLDYREVGDLRQVGSVTRMSGLMPAAPSLAGYDIWWDQASRQERMAAVGAARYKAAKAILGRDPAWFELIDQTGRLLSPEELQAESPEARAQRVAAVRGMILQQEMAYLGLTRTGMLPARIPGLSVAEVIEAVEDAIRHEPVEYGVTISPDGTILFVKRGELNRVEYTEEESRLMQGAIMTHNHPPPRSDLVEHIEGISRQDVRFAIRRGMRSIRAVSPNRRDVMMFDNLPDDLRQRQEIANLIVSEADWEFQKACMQCRQRTRDIGDERLRARMAGECITQALERIWRSRVGRYITRYEVIRG